MKAVTTLREIATIAGVAPSTVSRALHGDKRISKATRERIVTIAEQRGYWSVAARPIGFLIANPRGGLNGDAFFLDVVDGVLEQRGTGRPVTIEVTEAKRYSPLPRSLRNDVHAGLIVGGIPIAPEWIEGLLETGIPTVFIGRYTDTPQALCSVIPDNFRGGQLAGEHLIAQGYEAFWFVGGDLSVHTFRDRYEGFKAGLAGGGFTLDERNVVIVEPTAEAAAVEIAKRLPKRNTRTGIFCATDWQASGVLLALRSAHLDIPASVGVIGYSDLPLAQHTSPSLTSIFIDRKQIGYHACRLLEDRVIGQLKQSVQVYIQPELRPRASTAAADHRDDAVLSCFA